MAQTFKMTQRFAAPLKEVLAARERRFEDVSKQEGLKGQELLDRKEVDGVITSKRAFSLADKLPDAIKALVPAGFLNLEEVAKFDTKTTTNRFEVSYPPNPDRLKITGETHYVAESDVACRRDYNITVKVGMALIGGMLEGQIASSFKKGIEKDYEVIKDLL